MVICRYLEVDLWSGVTENCDDLLMCRLKVFLVGGYLVCIWSGRADRYLVNYEVIQVIRVLYAGTQEKRLGVSRHP